MVLAVQHLQSLEAASTLFAFTSLLRFHITTAPSYAECDLHSSISVIWRFPERRFHLAFGSLAAGWVDDRAPESICDESSFASQISPLLSRLDESAKNGYQWLKNGSTISAATSPTLTLANVTPGNAGNYTVKVTSGASSRTSPNAILTVDYQPSITSTTSATFVEGQAGNFTLTATAVPTATYSATGLPPWAALDANTGIISGTPPDTSGSPFSVAVAASNGISPDAAKTLTISVLTPFAAWQNANFTAGELANPAISGPTIALGPDGVSNLLKYALGVAPRAALPVNAQTVAQAGGNWTYTYQRPSNRVDLVYAVEVSTDLQSWSATGVTLQRTATADANGMETWQGSCTNSGPNLFFRLRVTAP